MSRRIAGRTVAVLAMLVAGPAMAMFVDVQFLGGVDISSYATWAWTEGTPAPNFEVERAVRATIEELMAKKGYLQVEREADCVLAIHVQKDDMFEGGNFRIEILDGQSREVVWRGKAEGTMATQKPKKRQALARRAVKKMFKKVPEKR